MAGKRRPAHHVRRLTVESTACGASPPELCKTGPLQPRRPVDGFPCVVQLRAHAVPLVLVSIVWAALVAWLIIRAARQGQALERLSDRPWAGATLPAAAIIVPARNEGTNIAGCLHALLAQDYPRDRLRIIVADDESTDGTGALARQVAPELPALTVVQGGPLPPGWVGKPHGCAVGAAEAGAVDWLAFVDADVRLMPGALSAAIAEAERAGIDMLSLTPRQHMVTPLERLIIPCGLYVLAFTQRLESQRDGDGVSACGQFMLVRRAAYDAIGGHGGVRGEIAEDLALARRLARAGYRVRLMGGEAVASVRMYRDNASLWQGFAKNLVDMFGGGLNTVGLGLAGFLIAWLAVAVPFGEMAWSLYKGTPLIDAALGLAMFASAAAFAFHVAGALFLRIPFWYGLIFPVSYTLGAMLAIDSAWRRHVGVTRWKGRSYP